MRYRRYPLEGNTETHLQQSVTYPEFSIDMVIKKSNGKQLILLDCNVHS
jgi:hypothetical protein